MTSPGPCPRLAITLCVVPSGLKTTTSLFSRSATTALPSGKSRPTLIPWNS